MLEQCSGAAGKSRQRRARQLPVTDQRVVNQHAVLVSAVCGFCLDLEGEQSLSFAKYCIHVTKV